MLQAGQEICSGIGDLEELGDPEMLLEIMLALKRIDLDTVPKAARGARVHRADDGPLPEQPRAAEKTEPRFALPAEMAETGLQVWSRAASEPRRGRAQFLDQASPLDVQGIEILTKNSPSPRLAATLGLLLPGLGHLYAGAWKSAAAVFCAVIAGLLAGGELVLTACAGARLGALEPWLLATGGLVLVACAAGAMICSVCSAYRLAERAVPGGRPWMEDRPLLAIFGSAAVPGLGQFINGQPRKGAFFLAAVPILIASVLLLVQEGSTAAQLVRRFYFIEPRTVAEGVGTAAVLAVLGWILSIYDAALIASQHRRVRRRSM